MEYMAVNDFYEDDEPIEDIERAFAAGVHGRTAPSASLPGGATLIGRTCTFVNERPRFVYPSTNVVQLTAPASAPAAL